MSFLTTEIGLKWNRNQPTTKSLVDFSEETVSLHRTIPVFVPDLVVCSCLFVTLPSRQLQVDDQIPLGQFSFDSRSGGPFEQISISIHENQRVDCMTILDHCLQLIALCQQLCLIKDSFMESIKHPLKPRQSRRALSQFTNINQCCLIQDTSRLRNDDDIITVLGVSANPLDQSGFTTTWSSIQRDSLHRSHSLER